MDFKDCKRFNYCGANICPYDPDKNNKTWYPGEEICNLQNRKNLFIRNQKKIAKRCKAIESYFTYAMLNRKCIIRTGVKGIFPDSQVNEKQQEINWLKKHLERESRTLPESLFKTQFKASITVK